MTIHFSIREFRELHGFHPRGVARWTFYFADSPTVPWQGSDVLLSYTEAKQLARAEAQRRGVTAVRVDPDPKDLRIVYDGYRA